jgi:hypothetical protein
MPGLVDGIAAVVAHFLPYGTSLLPYGSGQVFENRGRVLRQHRNDASSGARRVGGGFTLWGWGGHTLDVGVTLWGAFVS